MKSNLISSNSFITVHKRLAEYLGVECASILSEMINIYERDIDNKDSVIKEGRKYVRLFFGDVIDSLNIPIERAKKHLTKLMDSNFIIYFRPKGGKKMMIHIYTSNIYSFILTGNIIPAKKVAKEQSEEGILVKNMLELENNFRESVYKDDTKDSSISINSPKDIKQSILMDSFQYYDKVIALFDRKYYKEKEWVDCYDKLIRVDGYTEARIFEIVTEFRKEGNWWRDTGNFESLLKLRRLNPDKVKYIDVFDAKMKQRVGYIGKEMNERLTIKAPINPNEDFLDF